MYIPYTLVEVLLALLHANKLLDYCTTISIALGVMVGFLSLVNLFHFTEQADSTHADSYY